MAEMTNAQVALIAAVETEGEKAGDSRVKNTADSYFKWLESKNPKYDPTQL